MILHLAQHAKLSVRGVERSEVAGRRAQANLVGLMVMVGVAVVMGVAIAHYLGIIAGERAMEVEKERVVISEATSQVVRLLAVDTRKGDLWLLFRRLDQSLVGFRVLVELTKADGEREFLGCGSLRWYDEASDSDGLLCYEGGSFSELECKASIPEGPAPLSRVLLRPEGSTSWVSLADYRRSVSDASQGSATVCLIPYAGGNRYVLIEFDPGAAVSLSLLLLVKVGPDYYVVKTYEYSVSEG